jgi:hypothetical protein
MSDIEFKAPDFDPATHARFRGKPIQSLTNIELIEALYQALREIYRLQQARS